MTKNNTSTNLRILPSLNLTVTCSPDDRLAEQRTVTCIKTGKETSYWHTSASHPYDADIRIEYNRFPVVNDQHGRPWAEAAMYFLHRLSRRIGADTKSLLSPARDLAAYRQFLDENGMRFDVFPPERHYRPTYRFAGFLRNQVTAGETAISTAKRRINAVVQFYRYLNEQLGMEWDYEPYREQYLKINGVSSDSSSVGVSVITTDLRIKGSKAQKLIDNTIMDGGKLRPLPMDEQKVLLASLLETSNIEMKFLHLVALFTGSRIQSACLLRVGSFVPLPLEDKRTVIPIVIGPGTGTDTKKSKGLVLYFPRWLYEKLEIYAASPRWKIRSQKAIQDWDKDLVFITNRGTPYYESNASRMTFKANSRKTYASEGHAVRTFITKTLLPRIQTILPEFRFQFHDLRATAGMNLCDGLMEAVEQGNVSLSEVRKAVAKFLGHTNPETTDLYLNFRANMALGEKIQAKYEEQLRELAEMASCI